MFFLFYFWLVFCKKCLSKKILALELWIEKFLTNNVTSFYMFNILDFLNNFMVGDVIPRDSKVNFQ